MKSPTSKVQRPKSKWLSVCLLALWTLVIGLETCSADLTVSGTPGFIFSDTPSGRPTVANLNRALRMTYSVAGTIGGTNAGLAAKSVSGTMLMDSVVDNVTVEFDGSSPRAIQVKDSGVGVDQVSVALAGDGLGGGGGAAFSNKVDGITIIITNDVLTLQTNLSLAFLNVTSNSVVLGTTNNTGLAVPLFQFVTNMFGQITFTTSVACGSIGAAAKVVDTAHNLGVTPNVRAVLVCTTANLNYSVGDEIPAEYVWEGVNSANPVTLFTSSTNVGVVARTTPATWMVANKASTFQLGFITPGSWTLKLYARP